MTLHVCGMGSRKRWLFRLLAMALGPIIGLAVLEGLLRVADYGHITAFLIPRRTSSGVVLTSNPRFGWRFFGSQQARQPASFMISRKKPPDTIRIFVFGESAAYGDPLPEFGLPRLLESLLSLRFSGIRFEVVNAAMTGINSHAILPIARDCARVESDIWVIYMGNNEVVGPYGPGTVFGRGDAPLAWIRGSLALKTTRTGQLLGRLAEGLNRPPGGPSEWGGMQMFVKNQIRQDDPRMSAVYAHFARNLGNILELGLSQGAGIVLSTVAVNLRDCAPFASLNCASWPDEQRQSWKKWYRQGREAEAGQRWPEAVHYYAEAARIDDTHAELQFRWARCLLALGQDNEARHHFGLARDLDTLRFRCDSRLNTIVRDTAAAQAARRVRLADAEAVLASQSSQGVPGDNFFLEHVHLAYEGNYLLALTIARQVESLLPEATRRLAVLSQPWPSPEACARRLGWAGWNQHQMAAEVLSRLYDPPFTGQLNHDEQLRRWTRELERLRASLQPAALRQAEADCAAAVLAAPLDAVVAGQLARVRQRLGDLAGAQAAAERVVALLPYNAVGWQQLGLIQMLQHHYEKALDSWTKALQADPDSFWAQEKQGEVLAALGRHKDAVHAYQRAIVLKPRLGPAYLGLGKTLEAMGRKSEAEAQYRLALQNPVLLKPELVELGHFCRSRGWHAEALTNYLKALRMNPSDAVLHLHVGQTLDALQRNLDARRHYAEAARLDPGLAPARFLLGLQAGRQSNAAAAAEQFQAAVQLMPDLAEARINLGIALAKLGRQEEARTQFEEVLRRDPTNAMALRQLGALKAQKGSVLEK